MSVICQCPSCKAKYQVGDQYAGHKIKCPKCSAAVNVPAAATPARSAPVMPVAADADDTEMAFAQTGDDTLGFLEDAATVRKHHGERSGKHRAAVRESSVPDDDSVGPKIGAKESTSPAWAAPEKEEKVRFGNAYRRNRRRLSRHRWNCRRRDLLQLARKPAGSTASSDDKKQGMQPIDPSVPMLMFTFDWPESDAAGQRS